MRRAFDRLQPVRYDPDRRHEVNPDPHDPAPDGSAFGMAARRPGNDGRQTFRAARRPVFCDRCGGREFWQPYEGGRWFCGHCRPQPAPMPQTLAAPAISQSTTAAPAAIDPELKQSAAKKPRQAGTQPAQLFPEIINHYSVLSLQATRTKGAGGGYRAWLLSKAIDIQQHKGRGRIRREDLRAYFNYLNVDPRTYRHCIDEARALGLLEDVQAIPEKGGEWWFILASYPKAARALFVQSVENDQERTDRGRREKGANVPSIGTRKTTIQAVDLFGDGWRARVWACYEKSLLEKSIGQQTKRQLTQIPESTQTRRNKQAGVIRRRGYAVTATTCAGMINASDKGDRLRGLRENSGRKGLHVRHDGRIQFFVPSYSIITDESITVTARGSARKYNKNLRAFLRLEGLPLLRQSLTSESEPDASQGAAFYRIFNYTTNQFKRTREKIREIKPRRGDLFACPKQTRTGARLWEHAFITDYLPGGRVRA